MLILLTSLLVTLANCQPIVCSNLFSKFSAAIFQPDIFACAISNGDRSLAVRSQAQCIHECQHGGDTAACVGVNFRQKPSYSCDVYFRCPTNYTHNVLGCQYIQVILFAFISAAM
jgi:hypothetical protein